MDKNRLNSAAKDKTKKLFSGATDPNEKKTKSAQVIKMPKKVFSFRGPDKDVDKWRLYATLRGEKADDLWSTAMNEFIHKHPLKGAAKDLFDEKMNS